MFRKLRYNGSDECLTYVRSLCCFAAAHDGVEIMWHALQMMSGNLSLCIHIAGSWARSLTNIKSFFCNEDVFVVRVLCLRRCPTAHSIFLVIINISPMIKTSAFFKLVKMGLGSDSIDK